MISFNIIDYVTRYILYNGIRRHIQHSRSAQPEQRLYWLHFMLNNVVFNLFISVLDFELQCMIKYVDQFSCVNMKQHLQI